jgi:L-aspartate oxidase
MVPPADGPHGGGTTAEFLARRFPTIDAAVRAHGVDWSREPVPVTPAAHYLMGGIATDDAGRTTLPGLYAVGECAATGVHGANRLASNSLLEGAVFGIRVVDALAADRRRPHDALLRLGTDGPGLRPLPATPGDEDGGVPFERHAFQAAMWAGAGVLRTGAGLEELSRRLAGFRLPEGQATGPVPTRSALEDRNLLTVGRAVAAAALHRTESRGAHFREDMPVPDPAQAQRTFWHQEHPSIPAPSHALTSTHAGIGIFERTPAC